MAGGATLEIGVRVQAMLDRVGPWQQAHPDLQPALVGGDKGTRACQLNDAARKMIEWINKGHPWFDPTVEGANAPIALKLLGPARPVKPDEAMRNWPRIEQILGQYKQ